MLTADLIRPRLGWGGGKVWTRPLGVRDERTLKMAADLTALYRDHVGRKRGDLEEALSDYEGESLEIIPSSEDWPRPSPTAVALPPSRPLSQEPCESSFFCEQQSGGR
jgi:hypothetical protein